MKKLLILMCLTSAALWAQPVTTPITYLHYATPLRLNRVLDSLQINYANPEGLLLSYYSATNSAWALKDYLKKPEQIVRDQEHFDQLKKQDTATNYVQLETILLFTYKKREMAFVKYAFILKELPFPLLATLCIEKANGRWYLSQLEKQDEVMTVLSNLDPAVLIRLMALKPGSASEAQLVAKTKDKSGYFSYGQMYQQYTAYLKAQNTATLRKLRDKRLIGDGSFGEPAKTDTKPTTSRFTVSLPFAP